MGRSQWVRAFAAGCKLDKIKLTFPDVHPIHRQNVDEAVSFCVQKLMEEFPTVHCHLPKATILDPSPAKPNGKYIIELQGFVAEAAKYLPAGWLQYVTYADVKCFVALNPAHDIDNLLEVFLLPGGVRNYAPTFPGKKNKSATKQRTMSHRLGSCKSGTHLTAYQRPAQPVGFEGKFKDEAVHDVTLTALDLLESKRVNDQGAWLICRHMWGIKAAETWAQEFYARNIEPSSVCIPITWEMYQQGYEYNPEELEDRQVYDSNGNEEA